MINWYFLRVGSDKSSLQCFEMVSRVESSIQERNICMATKPEQILSGVSLEEGGGYNVNAFLANQTKADD